MPNTPNYEWALPTVGASFDTHGGILNAAFDSVDAQVFTISTSIDGKLDTSGGGMTGPLTGTSATFSEGVSAPTFTGNLAGNATTSGRWANARTLSLEGVVTGSVSIDGSDNGAMTTAIADGALSLAMVSGLTTELGGKQNVLNEAQKRTITYGSAAPSGTPLDGDIYLQYEV